MDTELAKKMIAIADRDNLPEDHELRVKALEFEEIYRKFFHFNEPDETTTKQFLGTWTKARKAFAKYTGTDILEFL